MSGGEEKPTVGEQGAGAAGEEGGEGTGERRTDITERYAGASRVTAEGDATRVTLAGDLGRGPVRADGTVKEAVPLREALSALHEVVQSDFRYKPKDRTAYLAYQRMRKQTATLSSWDAQRAYFAWISRNDPLAFCVLDPIVTVHPDALVFEVFSQDEGTYAQLAIDWSALEVSGERTLGTTNIDFSQALYDGVQRMRSYRETRLTIGRDAVGLATAGEAEVLEKKVQVPDSWLRGFTQVQSASTLPATTFSLAPVDLYNVLRHLRLNADKKKGGRGIRVELVPGEAPRLVLEPWEEVIPTTAGAYAGRTAQVVRVWGRRRLMLARRFLPFVERVDVHLLGSGLPSFYVLRGGPVTLTIGLTGFSSANWAQQLSFDVMLPRPDDQGKTAEAYAAVLAWLGEHWKGSLTEVAKGAGLKPADTRQALQAACQAGQVMYDLAHDVYRLRPLTETPLDPSRLEYRNDRERQAHDLLNAKNAVRIAQENFIRGVGLELTGRVVVEAEKREYRPQILVADEGRVTRAECTCGFFRKHQLKEGPCAHLIALRLRQALDAQKRDQQRGRARSTITVETRTYTRRHPRGETLFQVSLDRQRLKVRWGERSDASLRVQQLVFGTAAEARAAYFARIDELEAEGYLDATAG